MLRIVKTVIINSNRTFKNFGHKRQPVPRVTVLWHGFLTFTFIGLCIEWKKMARLIFGIGENEAIDHNIHMQGAHHTSDK